MRRVLTVLALVVSLTGCAALNPKPESMAQRLSVLPRTSLPLDKPVTIRWNTYQVPFVEAETDHDLAFAMGMVHAHLRLGQIRVLKQVVQGRLSEMTGPASHDTDYSLRILDVGRAAPDIVRQLSPEGRMVLDAFVEGINYYQAHLKVMPPEFALLGLEPEPFTAEDLVAIGRLGGVDVNWPVYMDLLHLRDRPDWQRIWSRALSTGTGIVNSIRGRSTTSMLKDVFLNTARWGSNALVVSPVKSATGSALVAGDPHLGLGVPNLWLLAGMRSPSFRGVGFMVPGLPVIAEGRSPDLAWAGTNMRAANSDVYDISTVRDPSIQSRDTLIKTRFWFDVTRRLRTSRFGSIISDSPLLGARPGETLALRWIGYQPTDEVGDLLKVMEARNAGEFHDALAGFAVSPQNFLCADAHGNICHVLATVLPLRKDPEPKTVVLDASDAANDWRSFADARTLPFQLNPSDGFLVSANNRPDAITPYPISYFYSAEERAQRMEDLLRAHDKVTIDDLKHLQRDTLSLYSRDIAEGLVDVIDSIPEARAANPAFLARLKSFGGDYRADAPGPVAFETLLYHLVPTTYGAASPAELPDPYSDLRQLRSFLVSDIEALPPEAKEKLLVTAIEAAALDSAKFKTWGDMHRLSIHHWFANLPLLGGYFEYGDYPTGGSRETVMKTSHGLTNSVEPAAYGSQARFVADMGDPDSAEFVLIGGNDGWLGSANALDQVPLWRTGQYIKMPLRPATVAREFSVVTTLSPR